MTWIVVDKSWLQGVNANKIKELAQKYKFLFPAYYGYELFTSTNAKQLSDRQLIGKLKEIKGKYDFVDHNGAFIKYEMTNKEPVVSIDSFILQNRYFNPCIVEENYDYPLECKKEIDKWKGIFEDKNPKEFVQLISSVDQMIPEIKMKDIKLILEKVQDDDFLIKLANNPKRPLIRGKIVDSNWVIFKRFRLWLAVAIRRYHQYHSNYNGTNENLAHDLLDVEYALVASITKNLATNDGNIEKKKGMKWFFSLVCKDGIIHGIEQNSAVTC